MMERTQARRLMSDLDQALPATSEQPSALHTVGLAQ